MYPLVLARLSRQFKKTISYSECQIQATRLGCAKLQHDERVSRLIEASDRIINSDGNIFAFHNILKSAGYPYATFTTDGRFKITVIDWVNSFLDLNCTNLGMPKAQLAAMCFLIGISDYSELSELRAKEIKKELDLFWQWIEHRLSMVN